MHVQAKYTYKTKNMIDEKMESSWFYHWDEKIIKVHYAGNFLQGKQFQTYMQTCRQIIGGKFGNAQTWCNNNIGGKLKKNT